MASIYTILSDTFSGTAGASVVGTTPDTVQNGSDVWGDGSGLGAGEGILAIASGGAGATSSGSTSDTAWSASYALTGVTGGQGTYAVAHSVTDGNSTVSTYLRTPTSGFSDAVAVDLVYGNSGLSGSIVLTVISGGTPTATNGTVTLTAGTTYTLVVILAGTTASATLNGTALFTGVTVPASSLSRLYIRQQLGAAGDIKVNSVSVTVPGPDTAVVTGPTAIVEGVTSTNYAITLSSAVPAGGAGITFTPASTVFTAGTTPTVTIPSGQTIGIFIAQAAVTGVSHTGTMTAAETAGGSGTSVTAQANVVASPYAATVAVTGPGTLSVGTPGTYTFTLSTPAPGEGVSIAPSATVFTANFGANPISIAAGQTVGTTTVTATSTGAGTVTGSGTGLSFTAADVTAGSSAATAYTLTNASPSSGFVANASASFAVQANGTPSVSLVVTPSDGSGGTFSPSTLTIADAAAHTFTYTPASAGTKMIAVAHAGGGFSGDPASVTYTANARTLSVSPTTVSTSSSGTLAFTGPGAKWLSAAPTFGPTGVSAFSLGTVTVVDDTHCTAPYTASTATGTETFTDSTTSATAAISVASAPGSDQLSAYYPTFGLSNSVYFVICKLPYQTWNGTAFENTVAANWTTYPTFGVDVGSVGIYAATFPAGISPGIVSIYAYKKAGSTAAPSDTLIGTELDVYWDGSSLSSGAASSGGGVSPAQLASALSPLLALVTMGSDGFVHPPASWLDRASYARDLKLDGTCQSGTTASTVKFDANDPVVNAMALGDHDSLSITIYGGTGLGNTIPIRTISGAAGSRIGSVPTYFTPEITPDATSGYLWNFDVPMIPGEHRSKSEDVIRCVLGGRATSVAGADTFMRPDGTPVIEVDHDAFGNRTASTNLG